MALSATRQHQSIGVNGRQQKKHMTVSKVSTRNKSNVMLSIINITLGYYFAVLKCDRKAAGALEYALLVSFIAIAVIGGVTQFGDAVSKYFSDLATHVGGLAH